MSFFDNRFIIIKKICLDFSEYKISKMINIYEVTFLSIVYCLELFYLFQNFCFDLLTRYSPLMICELFLIFTTFLDIIYNKKLSEIIDFLHENSWFLDILNNKSRTKLLKRCRTINIAILVNLIIISFTALFLLPIFGKQNELFFCIQVFEKAFGFWCFLPYYLYFLSLPLFIFSCTKIFFLFVYGVLNLYLQYSLINEYLLLNFDFYMKSWSLLEDTQYQTKISQVLCSCIKQQVFLKRFYKKMLNILQKTIPVIFLFAILIYTSSFFYVIKYGDTMSNNLKIRIFFLVIAFLNSAFLIIWTCQEISDAAVRIFDTLVSAPHYFWNFKNCKILLTFLTNCTKCEAIAYFGICLDYRMVVSVLQTSVSYAIIFFQLGQANK